MGRVAVNQTSVSFAIEASLGILPGAPTWKLTEPNDITAFGATITKVARDPISKLRQRRKGTTTDLDSAMEMEHDLTKEIYQDFIEGVLFAVATHPDGQPPVQSGALFDDLAAVAATPGYSHDALAAAIPTGRLVMVRGFDGSANNGLQEVDAAGTTTSTIIVGGAHVDETPGNVDNATMAIAGVRGAVGDITLTVSGVNGTLGSTLLDFTTLGLSRGQVIHVGGVLSANQFATAGPFYARISGDITATTIPLDKLDPGVVTDAGAGILIDLMYGAFVRNVSTDDVDFLERSYQFELTLTNLQDPGPGDEWEYAIANEANVVSYNLPLTDKATITFGFVGTDTELPVTTQKTNADTPVETVQTTAFNTSADIARLRLQQVDETGLTTCFKNLVLSVNNQIGAEKCLGNLGALFLNQGNLLVDVEAQLLLTSSAVIAAIRNNDTLTLDFILKNEDGAIAVDIPSLTLGGGDKEFPQNESVLINTTAEAFVDPVLGYSMASSIIEQVPLS